MGDLYRDLVAERNEALELGPANPERDLEADELMDRVYESIDRLDDSVFEYRTKGDQYHGIEGMSREQRVDLEAEVVGNLASVLVESFAMADVLDYDIRQAFTRQVEHELRNSDDEDDSDRPDFVDCVPFDVDDESSSNLTYGDVFDVKGNQIGSVTDYGSEDDDIVDVLAEHDRIYRVHHDVGEAAASLECETLCVLDRVEGDWLQGEKIAFESPKADGVVVDVDWSEYGTGEYIFCTDRSCVPDIVDDLVQQTDYVVVDPVEGFRGGGEN